MNVEPVTAVAPRSLPYTLLTQRWEELSFLHWPVGSHIVAPLLPPGTRPDTIDGLTYVGLIGFRMVGIGLLGGPRVPYLGSFCETNVRLYSVDEEGRRGVVFRSLEAERLVPVLAAHAGLGLPYRWASMRLRRDGDVWRYSSWRLGTNGWAPGGRGPTSRMTVRVGAEIDEATPLEHFLTARWGLHVQAYGQTLYLPNVHPQWKLHRAELLHLDDELVAAAGLPAPDDAPVSVLYSPGVPVRFGPPTVVRTAAVPR